MTGKDDKSKLTDSVSKKVEEAMDQSKGDDYAYACTGKDVFRCSSKYECTHPDKCEAASNYSALA